MSKKCFLSINLFNSLVLSYHRVTLENHYHQNGNGTRDLTTFSNHYTQVPRNENEPLKPATVPALQPPPVPSKRGSMFDDPVYDAGFTSSSSSSSSYHPPVTKKRSLERGMRTSLERGMKVDLHIP